MKKSLILAIFLLSGVIALGETAQSAECLTLKAGDLFKVPQHPAVYVVTKDLKRKYFPNSEVFSTWYDNFSRVQTIDVVCAEQYSNAGGVNYRPGSRLIKSPFSSNVFIVGVNNIKHKVWNETVAKTLYGENWARLIRDVPDIFSINYTMGAPIVEPKPHDGQLVKQKNASKVYYVQGGVLFEIADAPPSNLLADVRVVSDDVFKTLSVASTKEKTDTITADASQGRTYSKFIVQNKPVVLTGDQVLEIKNTHYVLNNSITVRDNAKLIVEDSFLEHRKDHAFQYELKAQDQAKIILKNVKIVNECNGAYNWSLRNYASLTAENIDMPACGIWTVFAGSATAAIKNWDKVGASTCDYAEAIVEDSDNTELQLCYGPTAVVDETLPTSTLSNYIFPNDNEKNVGSKLTIKNSSVARWGAMVQPSADVTIRNSPSVNINIVVGWPWRGQNIVLDGLQSAFYADNEWRIGDARLHVVNTGINNWEPNVWEDNTLTIRNMEYFGSTSNGRTGAYTIDNVTAGGPMRTSENVRMTIKNSLIKNDIIAVDNSIITLINTTVSGRLIQEGEGKVYGTGK